MPILPSHHFNEQMAIANKDIGLIKFLSSYCPIKTLDQIYKMYVRPHLDYCDIIYNNPFIVNKFDSQITLSTYIERLEKVQYQAALAVTGCWQGTNRNKLDDELGWESLAHRRWTRRIIHLFKIIQTKSPAYWYELLHISTSIFGHTVGLVRLPLCSRGYYSFLTPLQQS